MPSLVAHNPQRVKLFAGNAVPTTRTIAGIDLRDDITVEELRAALDIQGTVITSSDRPPSGAPPEVDTDLFRVGDVWIQQGAYIVYELVEAQYNYRPAPGVEPYHKFTWQPLNERYRSGGTEPPTVITYQTVSYSVGGWHWSWLPVPEYFSGDHYQMLMGIDEPTYYICKSASMPTTGVCTYTWREEGGSGDLSNYYTKTEIDSMIGDIGDRLDRVRGVANE